LILFTKFITVYLVPTRQRGNAVSTAPAVLDDALNVNLTFISFPRASVGMP
jgi:hypothetical protein